MSYVHSRVSINTFLMFILSSDLTISLLYNVLKYSAIIEPEVNNSGLWAVAASKLGSSFGLLTCLKFVLYLCNISLLSQINTSAFYKNRILNTCHFVRFPHWSTGKKGGIWYSVFCTEAQQNLVAALSWGQWQSRGAGPVWARPTACYGVSQLGCLCLGVNLLIYNKKQLSPGWECHGFKEPFRCW